MNDLLANSGLSPGPLDFGDEAVRRRLGPSALLFFRRVVDIWRVPGEESSLLLGLGPDADLDGQNPERLGEEQMLRISYLIGIYRALHTVHGDELADEWITLPNSNALFGGQTPLAFMLNGGIDALRNIRRLLEGRCQGK